MDDDAAFALQVVDAAQYLVLATAGADGRPWPTPVWFARDGRSFLWVSRPDARHSVNLHERSAVSFVLFETPVPAEGRTRAVYAEASAEEVAATELARTLIAYDRRARATGSGAWTSARVTAPAALRLYRAEATRLFVLEPDRDIRREVELRL